MVSGVDREPGEITACATPRRTSVSASTLHHKALVLRKSKGVITHTMHSDATGSTRFTTVVIFPIAKPSCGLFR
jgi:hypothetical protein